MVHSTRCGPATSPSTRPDPLKIRGAVLERVGDARPFAQSQPIQISELDLAPPGPGELLVRIEAAGLCHSDLSVIDGSRPRPVPMLLGHEAAGIVSQVGPGGSDLEVGQRVVMTFLPRCGACEACATEGLTPCVVGNAANGAGVLVGGGLRLSRDGLPVNHHLGVSGFATYAVVSRTSVVPVDADIPPAVAAVLGCAVLTGGGAVINAGRPSAGQRVIVVGLGGVGLAAVLTALARPDVEVIAIDTLPDKLAAAIDLGAHAAYAPAAAIEAGVKAPIVIEAAGNVRALRNGDRAHRARAAAPSRSACRRPMPASPLPRSRSWPRDARSSAAISGRRCRPATFRCSSISGGPAGCRSSGSISSTIELADINAGMDALADGRAIRQIINFAGRAVTNTRSAYSDSAPTSPTTGRSRRGGPTTTCSAISTTRSITSCSTPRSTAGSRRRSASTR